MQPKAMTVDECREQRRRLEAALTSECLNFALQTGLKLTDISFSPEYGQALPNNRWVAPSVKVTVEL